jgi:hypothetical protein
MPDCVFRTCWKQSLVVPSFANVYSSAVARSSSRLLHCRQVDACPFWTYTSTEPPVRLANIPWYFLSVGLSHETLLTKQTASALTFREKRCCNCRRDFPDALVPNRKPFCVAMKLGVPAMDTWTFEITDTGRRKVLWQSWKRNCVMLRFVLWAVKCNRNHKFTPKWRTFWRHLNICPITSELCHLSTRKWHL